MAYDPAGGDGLTRAKAAIGDAADEADRHKSVPSTVGTLLRIATAAAESGTSLAAALAKTDRPPMPPRILQDLRRTAATGMAKLGIVPHIIEKVLNHVTGPLAGVAGIYNRFGYGPAKRHALETWAAHIE